MLAAASTVSGNGSSINSGNRWREGYCRNRKALLLLLLLHPMTTTPT